MIIAEANFGRLGNCMFTYAFSRLLAEALGYSLYCPSVEGFGNTRKHVEGGIYRSGYDEEILITDCDEPFESIVERCQGKRVRVRGFFEQSRYYIPHRDKIKKWFERPTVTYPYTAVHVRGTDFGEHKRDLPTEYFCRALWNVHGTGQRIVIATDDPGCEQVKFLQRCGATLSPEPMVPNKTMSALEDFDLIRDAESIVISRSTFSWWAAFLSDATNIAQPAPATGHRSKADVLSDLTMPGWIQIPC